MTFNITWGLLDSETLPQTITVVEELTVDIIDDVIAVNIEEDEICADISCDINEC